MYTGISLNSILILLIVLSVSCLCSFLRHPVPLGILFFACSLGCLWVHPLGLFLPVLVYDAAGLPRKICFLPIILGSLFTCSCFPSIAFPFLLIGGISLCLSLYSQYMDKLYHKLHRTRDEGKEKEVALRQRNQALIEKQNADIHAATLAERNRIARDIHDNVGHMLTRSILQVGALKVINDNTALQQPIEDLQNTLNTAMTSVRTSVHDLHEDVINLHSVLLELTEAVENPVLTLEYDMGERIPREIKYAFIAIVKEAINNMQKHSNATMGQIRLREHPGFFYLHIWDNGTSIKKTNFPSIRTDGIGLSNMEERVRSLGGTIRFYTEDGFKILITIRRQK